MHDDETVNADATIATPVAPVGSDGAEETQLQEQPPEVTSANDLAPMSEDNDKEESEAEEVAGEPASETTNVVESEPYDFDRCTIQVGLQLLPGDGAPAGRPVVVGVRNHADAPIVKMLRLSELGTLPPVIAELLNQLRAEMPARQKAREEALAKKKAEEEAAQARRKATKAKTGKKEKAASKPKKLDLSQAPDVRASASPAKTPAVPAPASAPEDSTDAQSEQLFMF